MIAKKEEFAGKIVAISGATGGFGRAMVSVFAEAGARLVLIDRSADELHTMALQAKARAVSCDQSDFSSIDQAADEIGSVDVFVNNAGLTIRKPLFEMTEEELCLVINVNLTGSMLLTTAIARRMAHEGGSGVIVNLTSQIAYAGGENRGVYAVSKAGLTQFTKTAAIEWARYGIRVCAIAPGAADTPMTADLQKDVTAMARIGNRVPSGRMIPAEEIAKLVLFLSSNDARSVVGQTLIADDGFLLT